MSEHVTIKTPVRIESDSKCRVAYDLATKIDAYGKLDSEQKDRKYWLTLYHQCYKAANGRPLEEILKEV